MTRIRVACHVHSEWSYDGKWSLEEIAAAFFRRGYQAVMMTEHDRGLSEQRRLEHREACSQASSADILLLPGIEYSDGANCVHILVWGDVPFIGAHMDTRDVLAAVAAAGGIAVLAHPSRKQAWRRFDALWGPGLIGIESWNRKTDGWAPSRDAQPLLQTSGALPFVGLDFHDQRQFFPLAMVLEVNPPISEAAVLGAIRSRRCSFEAFGSSIQKLSGGLPARALQMAELLRRSAAPIYRKFVAP